MSFESKCPKRDRWIPMSECDCTDEETAYYHHKDFDGTPFIQSPSLTADVT